MAHVWNVRFPNDFRFAELPRLELVDIRGGNRGDLAYLSGAEHLRGLVVSRVRGLTYLRAVSGLTGLRILSPYGLAGLEEPPDPASLVQLERLEIGPRRSLAGWRGLAS